MKPNNKIEALASAYRNKTKGRPSIAKKAFLAGAKAYSVLIKEYYFNQGYAAAKIDSILQPGSREVVQNESR